MSNKIDGKRVNDNYVVLTVPLTHSKNREGSGHWAGGYKIKKEYAKYAYEAWLCAGMPKFDAANVFPIFYVWSLRDEDNSNGVGFKGVIDGLKGHMIPDDSPKYLTLGLAMQQLDRKNMRLELHIKRREVSA